MKTFKEYTNADSEFVGFANSGGHRDTYKNFQNITENLNPRNSTQQVSQSRILDDPIIGNYSDKRYHASDLMVGHNPFTMYVRPYFTKEMGNNIKSLLNNTDHRDEEYKSIVEPYTDSSASLNQGLFDHYHNKKPIPKILGKIEVRSLDKLIDKHRLPHPITVYTGLHFDPNKSRGKIVRLPAFTSTSISPHVSKEFGEPEYKGSYGHSESYKHILRLQLPKNFPHLFTDPHSYYCGQGELILPRNLRLQIGHTPTHTVSGNFLDHFDDSEYANKQKISFWNGRIL